MNMPKSLPKKRRFVGYFWFVGWTAISVGFHVCLRSPNIEIHVPFGFFRIGWKRITRECVHMGFVHSGGCFGWNNY